MVSSSSSAASAQVAIAVAITLQSVNTSEALRGGQLGGGEINIVDLCVTIFDAVFDFNLKWNDLSMTQLCCTSSEIACFHLTRCCITSC